MKRTKSTSASSSRWDAALIAEPLSDDSFKLSVEFLVPESPAKSSHIALVAECIATRLRRRFIAVSRDELVAMAQDEGKATAGGGKKGAKGSEKTATPFSEVCEHVRQALNGPAGVTASLEARLLKYYLLKKKREHLTKKDPKSSDTTAAATTKGGRGESRKGAKSGKGGKGSPKKGGDIAKESDAPFPAKPETKMKKRGEEDDLVKSLDDEPEDGPDMYAIVHGFSSTAVLLQCAEIGVSVDCVTKVADREDRSLEESPTLELAVEEENEREGLAQQAKSLKSFWTDLDRVFKSPTGHSLRDMALLQIKPPTDLVPEAPEQRVDYSQLFFGQLAELLYELIEKRKQFQLYLQSLQIVPVPHPADNADQTDATSDADLRLYNWLMDSVPCESCSVPLMMHCMLEQVVANVDEGGSMKALNSMEDETSTKSILDKFIVKLSLSTDDKKMLLSETDKLSASKAASVTTVLRQGDESFSRVYHLRSVDGFDPVMAESRMIQLLPYYHFRNFSLFYSSPADSDEIDSSACKARKHEVQHILSEAGVDPIHLDRSLKQFTFETMNLQSNGKPPKPLFRSRTNEIIWDDPYAVPTNAKENFDGTTLNALQSLNLDDWCVEEHLEPSTLLQVLSHTHARRLYCDAHYHKATDSLLLTFHNASKSATENRFDWTNSVHTPIGFSNYLRHVSSRVGGIVDEANSMALEEAKEQARRLAKEREEEAAAAAAAKAAAEQETAPPDSGLAKSRQQSRASSRKDKEKTPSVARSNVSSRSSTRKGKEKGKSSSSAAAAKRDVVSSQSERQEDATTATITAQIPKLFLAFDVGDRVLRTTGSVRQIFSANGGVVTVKRWSFVDGTEATCFGVENDGCAVNLHWIPNDDEDEDEDEDNDSGDVDEETKDGGGDENVPIDDSILPRQLRKPKLPCKFSSFVVRFDDGMTAAVSKLGRNGGRSSAKEKETTAPAMEAEKTSGEIADVPSQRVGVKAGGKKKDAAAAEQALLEQQRLQEEEAKRRREAEEEKKRQALDDALRPKYQELFVSLPDGLGVQYDVAHEGELESLREDSHLDGGRVVVRMSYDVRTRAVQSCEGRRAAAMKNELSRCVTKDGTVVKLMKDGSTHVLFADGTVSTATAANAYAYRGATTTETDEKDEAETMRAHSPSRRVTFSGGGDDDGAFTGGPLHPQKVVDVWKTTGIDGNQFLHKANCGDEDERIVVVSDVMTSYATDPQSKETMLSRADGVTIVRRSDGSAVVEHADGTRMTTYCEADRAFVRVEHPSFVALSFDRDSGACRTEFGNGVVISSTNRGEYRLERGDGNVVDIAYDGELCFVPKSAGMELPSSDGELLPGAYVLHPTAEAAVRFGDVTIRRDGTVVGNGDSGNGEKFLSPRLFVVHRDGSGTALMRKADVVDFLSAAADDPAAAILTEPIEDAMGAKAITVLKTKLPERWTMPYAEKTIIPPGLRDRNSENDDAAKSVSPPTVIFRQFVEYPRLDEEGRLNVMNAFCRFLRWREDQRQVERSLLLPDRRSDDEKAKAAKLASQLAVRDRTLSASKADGLFRAARELYRNKSDEQLLHDYEAALKRSVEPERRDVKRATATERTKARLEEHQREVDALAIGLKALRERDYDAPPRGNFLETALPNMKSLAAQLPENQIRATAMRPGGVSEMDELYPAHSSRSVMSGVDSAIDPGRATTHTPLTAGNGSPNESSPPVSVYITPSLTRIPESLSTDAVAAASPVRPLNPTPAKALGGSTSERPENPTPVQASSTSVTRPLNPTPGVAGENDMSPEKDQDTASEPGGVRHLSVRDPVHGLSVGGGTPLPAVGSKSFQLDVTGVPRKQAIKLPSSIKGSKAGALPNVAFETVEEPVRRKVATSSVAGSTALATTMRGFEILPDDVDFGVLREGYTYSYPVVLRNVGIDSCRFKLKQPPPSTGIKILYTPGPVAAGMNVQLDVEIFAVAVGAVGNAGIGSVEHVLEITTETNVLFVPIRAMIMTGTAYEHQKPDEKQVNVPHARVKLLSSKPPSREALIRNRKLRITEGNST